jgi:recombination protein RecA
MAAKKKTEAPVEASALSGDEKLVRDLITDLNKQYDGRIAYNLSTDESPTHVARWISTGSEILDYACSNCANGGLPEGRIVEIAGASGIGKSHVAAQICRSVQRMGGLAIYLDTENATDPMNLKNLGVDISKRFVYIEPACVEDVFDIVERTVEKVKTSNKNMPIVVIWDSLAATPAKAELEGDYDKETIGLQARALGRGFRKITQVIANQNVLFVINNQLRVKIGCVAPGTKITFRRS